MKHEEKRSMAVETDPREIGEGRKLKALVDRVLEWMLEDRPEIGTFLGRYERDDRLGSYSADAFEEQERFNRGALRELETEIDRSRLSYDDQIDYDLMHSRLDTEVWLTEHAEQKDWRREPALYFQLPTSAIHMMTLRDYAPLEERLGNILKRMEQLPRALEEGRANLRRPPRLWTEMAIESAQGSLALFEAYLPSLFRRVPNLAGHYEKQGPTVMVALRDYIQFLQTELLPRSTGAWPDGHGRFDYRLQHGHLLDFDSESLIAFGERLLAETEAEMTRLATEIEPGRDWRELIQETKSQHPEADGVMAAYERELERAREFVSSRGLVTLLDGEQARVLETPAPMRHMIPYAAYDMPPVFGQGDEGVFYVTPVDPSAPADARRDRLEGHNSAAIEVTTVHETYPGHHVQLVHAKRSRTSKTRKLAFSTVFIEGWALYCEQLMHEQGYYSDQRVRMMQLKDLLWRAARVVIDASIHTGRMTFQEAVDTLVERAALERSNAVAEVKRYTQSPTQPMSYAVGRQAILQLREEFRARQGAEFDLRRFHDRLLGYGSLPPSIITREMRAVLTGERGGPPGSSSG